MTDDVKELRESAAMFRETAAEKARIATTQDDSPHGRGAAHNFREASDYWTKRAALLDRAADALDREPALMKRVREAEDERDALRANVARLTAQLRGRDAACAAVLADVDECARMYRLAMTNEVGRDAVARAMNALMVSARRLAEHDRDVAVRQLPADRSAT